jgi:CheY-like chemotaxis protein
MTGETVLVVEDEGLIALHLTETLEKAGYRIVGTAYSGEMVLTALEKSPIPDLILMDIGLAGSIDGLETARRIRQHFDIPILFLTAYSNIAKIEELKSIKFCGYLDKPYLEHDLLAAIKKCLNG